MKSVMRYGWVWGVGAALMLGACDTRPKDVKKATVTEITNAAPPAATGTVPAATGAVPHGGRRARRAGGRPRDLHPRAKTDLRWTGYKVVGQHSGWFTLFDGTCKFRRDRSAQRAVRVHRRDRVLRDRQRDPDPDHEAGVVLLVPEVHRP